MRNKGVESISEIMQGIVQSIERRPIKSSELAQDYNPYLICLLPVDLHNEKGGRRRNEIIRKRLIW
jgi:hypothetical protein